MIDRTVTYCPECEWSRDGNYCSVCGEELQEFEDEESYIEYLRDEVVEWPISFRTTAAARFGGDYSHEVTDAAETDRIPFQKNSSEFYLGDYVIDEVGVEVTIHKDGDWDYDVVE